MMNKEKTKDLYDDIFDKFVALRDKKINEVIISPIEMKELDYIKLHTRSVIGNDGNYYSFGFDGRYNNYADVLREFAYINNFIQTIDNLSGDFIYRRGFISMNREEMTQCMRDGCTYQQVHQINNYIDTLEQQNQKYKEVLDKLKKYIEEHDYDYIYMDCKFIETEVYKKLKDILKEVE